VPGEFRAERACGGYLPEQMRLDDLVRQAGQFRVGPGRGIR
jgi:hypothetical protein